MDYYEEGIRMDLTLAEDRCRQAIFWLEEIGDKTANEWLALGNLRSAVRQMRESRGHRDRAGFWGKNDSEGEGVSGGV